MTDAVIHDSDCAIHNGPAFEPGPCDCSVSHGAVARFLDSVDADLKPNEVVGMLEPHHQRMVVEEGELATKIISLKNFITESDAFKALKREDQHLMHDQLRHMRRYRSVLVQRIMRIDTWHLPKENNT